MRFSMDVWKRRALRGSLQPKSVTGLVRQNYTLEIAVAVAVAGPTKGEVDMIKVVGPEHMDLEVLENCRPETGDVSKLKV